jgi:taurine dioxygenase
MVSSESLGAYNHISIGRNASALGAEIEGIQISDALMDDQIFEEIVQVFYRHQVIFFRGQNLTPENLMAFGERFGELEEHPFVTPLAGYPKIMRVVKEPEDSFNFGNLWHTDMSFREHPAMATILYARQTPAIGGDTMFANQYMAYDALSGGMKSMLDGLSAVHSAARQFGLSGRSADEWGGHESMEIQVTEDAHADIIHPVVRTHPGTGRKALYVNSAFTERFDGMTPNESQPLLEYLYAHSVRPEFTCRFQWTDDAVVLWDNRCVQHYALNDYPGERRDMHRVMIIGDRPTR